MPKVIELTVEFVVQKVSCPGVWLCQDGMVSLITFALGTSYETSMLPPTFPLKFNDRLYFRKRFQESHALSKICCLLKEETLYCELVQWSQNCIANEPRILAQYLGSLNDVLFPPKSCSSDGVDLLMRRSKDYPGILSPKIEVATKVRIDEVWNDMSIFASPKVRTSCACNAEPRQRPVCHSAEYHRNKCPINKRERSNSRARSRSRESMTCSSLKEEKYRYARSEDKEAEWDAYNEDKKVLLESRYVEDRRPQRCEEIPSYSKKLPFLSTKPCVCEICRKYHELFHTDSS